MNGTIQKLVDFVVQTRYEDLPEVVVHESKRVLLDSIGVAIAGLATDKGKYSIELARRLGGSPEATIVGVGDKVSCTSASFANGELINALDMDATLIPAHVSPCVISALLALAESTEASGKELTVANALAHEVSARLGRALTGLEYIKQELGREDTVFAPVYGYNLPIFGGTAGVGKILKLDREKMAHALGLACYVAPLPASLRLPYALPLPMVKYVPAGWMAQAEIVAALLAELGYTGDRGVLDGEHGFWKLMPGCRWDAQKLIEKLGERWSFLAIHYKPYPCCRLMHSGLDGFIKIIEQNNLQPEDIQEVRVLSSPLHDFPIWSNREIRTSIEAQFSMAYVFAVAAHRIRIGADWQDLETIRNPKILEFMNKVSFAPHPEFNQAYMENPRTELSEVSVVAKGQTFRQETKFAKGTHSPQAFRMTDGELAGKFRRNTSRILPQGKVDKAVEALFELDKIGNVAELMELVTI